LEQRLGGLKIGQKIDQYFFVEIETNKKKQNKMEGCKIEKKNKIRIKIE
jgi:hypothetical protein